MSAGDQDLVGHSDRQPLSAERLKPVSAAVCAVAFSSVEWVMRTFRCTEAEARTFKGNAQRDFESLLTQVRQAKNR